jgi:ParB family chromosome partitioning protein
MSTQKGLGKGFDVLMPVGINVSTVAAGVGEKVHRLALDVVVPKQDQPRQYFDTAALDQLAVSIREHGILQPLVVVQVDQNLYSIIAGERRWRAARLAGLTEVPAIVRSANEHEQLELALLENVQRSDLTPLEQSLTVYRLHTQFNQSYEDIAKRLGKAYTTVINSVRLLSLPPEMQESLQVGTISEGHARTLLSLQKFPIAQKTLFANMVSKGWSVRQSEQFVIVVKRGSTKDKPSEKPKQNTNYATTTKALEKQLGAKVIVQHSAKGKGKLVIS